MHSPLRPNPRVLRIARHCLVAVSLKRFCLCAVSQGSTTETFSTCVLHIDNERWAGVPFVMRAGKALDERKAEVRIQFKEVPGNIFDDSIRRNELVVRIQPNEAIWLNVINKKPGMKFETAETFLDMSYGERFEDARLPDAYERLILDAIQVSLERAPPFAVPFLLRFCAVRHRCCTPICCAFAL
jgi:hypothetical protein